MGLFKKKLRHVDITDFDLLFKFSEAFEKTIKEHYQLTGDEFTDKVNEIAIEARLVQ